MNLIHDRCLKRFMSLFGRVKSQLWNIGSSLYHGDLLLRGHGLSSGDLESPECAGFSSCDMWA